MISVSVLSFKYIEQKLIKGKIIEIKLPAQIDFSFSKIKTEIYRILDFEDNCQEIWLKNFPYCLLNSGSRDHILFDKNYKGQKISSCQNCKENKFCGGFPVGYFKKFGTKEIKPISDLPIEVMIEVEPKCNFHCQFCFNKISFASHGRDIKELSTEYYKKVIKNIAKLGIKIIRFTGGEPLLRSDIFELMIYAKKLGLEVRLNTNGSLINIKTARKLSGLVDNVLIPIESWNEKSEDKITGYKNSLPKKIQAIKLLKKNKIPIVRVGTVATKTNIKNFDKLAKLILNLPINEWEFYRPINLDKKSELNKKDIESLVNKIINLRKKTGKNIMVSNAIPFCAIKEKYKLNLISCGALFDEGHGRLIIDPRGFVKPDYFLNINIGDPLEIKKAWGHPVLKKIRGLNYLPKKCQPCRFKYKCRGGSRYVAKVASGDLFGQDPLIR